MRQNTHMDRYLDALRCIEPTEEMLVEGAPSGVTVTRIGPFCAVIDRSVGQFWGNTATPVGEPPGREMMRASIEQMLAYYRSEGCSPTVECNLPLWDALPAALQHAGFRQNAAEPLMICLRDDFTPLIRDGVSVSFLDRAATDDAVAAYVAIFDEVLLGEPPRPRERALAMLRQEIDELHGRSHVLAELDGCSVGTGFISSARGVAEITRVATLPAARRRGVAATLTSHMMADRFAAGDDLVWLTAQEEPARSLYERLGFRTVGTRLYYDFPELVDS
jgi:ribosomal protein S18 acetylase RimI-like enzyme